MKRRVRAAENGSKRYLYATAITVGVIPALLVFASLFSDYPAGASFFWVMARRFITMVIIYAMLGAGFSLAWPKTGWRWGLWIGGALSLVIVFFLLGLLASMAQGPSFTIIGQFLWTMAFILGAGGAACLAAHGGARLRMRSIK